MRDYSDDIRRYLSGEMTPAERHALEREALSDPFLAEALEGAELLSAHDFAAEIKQINRRLLKQRAWWMKPERIAAAVLVVGVAAFGLITLLPDKPAPSAPLALEQTSTASGPEAEPPVQGGTEALSAGSSARPERRDTSGKNETPAQLSVKDKRASSRKAESVSIMAGEEALAADSGVIIPLKPAQVANLKEAPPAYVTGKVLSSADGRPVPGVRVTVLETGKTAVTDEKGTYKVQADSGQRLVFSIQDQQAPAVEVKGKEVDDVQLQVAQEHAPRAADAKKETEAARRMQAAKQPAVPQGGMEAFYAYLKQAQRYPPLALEKKIEGTVVVLVVIDENGAVGNITTLRGIGGGCEEELMRLIREGPPWLPARKQGTPVRDTVQIELAFKLKS